MYRSGVNAKVMRKVSLRRSVGAASLSVLAALVVPACSTPASPAVGPAPQAVPIRRLTNDEYVASVNDLFPGYTLPSLPFVNDTKILGFTNLSSSQTSSLVRTEQYQAAAEAVARFVAADPTALTGCDVAVDSETACAQPYLYDLGKRAFRHPLSDAEKQSIWGLFSQGSASGVDYPTRLWLAIEGVLLSPKFLFRAEFGDQAHPAPQGIPLTPWEVATRLSYFLKGSTPDPELAAAADAGMLSQPDEVVRQAQRLLALPVTQEHLVGFQEQWLGIDSISALTKSPVAYPSFSPLLAYYMGQETHHFLHNFLFEKQGTLSDLFTAPFTYGNKTLADFYGVTAPANDWDQMDLNPAQRTGILTQGSLLATMAKDDSTDPVRRGKFILQQILCRNIMAPSADIVAMFQPLDLSKTKRDQFTQHRTSAACAGCHQYLDPLGLPFEHYDGTGKWRDNDRGMTLDVTGDIVDAMGVQNNFDGVPQLAQLVVQMPEARSCYATQWFRFTTGRLEVNDDPKMNPLSDAPYLGWLSSGFGSDTKILDLVTTLVSSDSFRYLKPGSTGSTAGSSP
jgi:hypothetical protein